MDYSKKLAHEAISAIDSHLVKNRDTPTAEEADHETEVLLFVRANLEEIIASDDDDDSSSLLSVLRIAEVLLRMWHDGNGNDLCG